MGRFVTDQGYIASIYPGELEPISKNVGPLPNVDSPRRTTYKLKPVKRGDQPYVLEVTDGFENVHDPMKSVARGEQPWSSRIVDYKQIRANLLVEWNRWFDAPPGAGLGIIAIAGPVPTDEEIQQMYTMQTTFAEWCFQRGEKAHRENNWKEIRAVDRILAKWLGKDAIWISPEKASDMVNCPFCRSRVDPMATICPTCRSEIGTKTSEMDDRPRRTRRAAPKEEQPDEVPTL